jgi:hypothetical protein
MNLSLAFVCASWSRLQVARRLPNDRPVLCPRIFSGMSQLMARKEPHSALESVVASTQRSAFRQAELPTELHETCAWRIRQRNRSGWRRSLSFHGE